MRTVQVTEDEPEGETGKDLNRLHIVISHLQIVRKDSYADQYKQKAGVQQIAKTVKIIRF